jgi:diguanylate cyclase (GGDEF)-like protein
MPNNQYAALGGTAGSGTPPDGLLSLLGFARSAAGADLVIAFEAGSDGIATPLATDPRIDPKPFSLASTRIESTDWSRGAVAADPVHLPSMVVAALDRPAHEVLFIPTPVPEAERSGILLLWLANQPARCDCIFRNGLEAQVRLLAPVFAQMVSDRRGLIQRRVANERFRDLFGSVPTGIVILEGNGQSGLVNEGAAQLLGIDVGELPVFQIAQSMRDLRTRCRNAAALNALYGPLQATMDYAVTAVWDFGTQQYEVDTHPVLGNGRNGRIWLFNDITAQRLVEEQLRALSVTDPLTGLNNRRHFMSVGSAAFATEVDPERPISALMIDIDHFKRVNDTYGHLTGDEVLRAVSSRMRGTLRKDDLLARLGGEEFAVLLEWLSLADIVETAERLRGVIAATPIATATSALEVRVSIGVAHRRPDDADLQALLARADRALYVAKNDGRNRVVIDQP